MKTSVSVSVRGKIINAQQIAAFNKSFAGQSDVITVWANFCAIHAIAHNNVDPVNNMLANPAFRLSTGKQSKLGREVFSYIKAHAPLISEDTKTGRFIVRKVKDTNPLYKSFVNPAELDDEEKPGRCDVGDFALSFDEWRTLEKAEKEPKPSSMKAATIIANMEKLAEAFSAGRVSASVEEAAAMLDQLTKVHALAVQLAAKLAGEQSAELASVDHDAAEKLLKSGQAGKALRAGGKVEAVA